MTISRAILYSCRGFMHGIWCTFWMINIGSHLLWLRLRKLSCDRSQSVWRWSYGFVQKNIISIYLSFTVQWSQAATQQVIDERRKPKTGDTGNNFGCGSIILWQEVFHLANKKKKTGSLKVWDYEVLYLTGVKNNTPTSLPSHRAQYKTCVAAISAVVADRP